MWLCQALKQIFVLVLGLDVLGNPFGVIRGLATGIEDLFYEPYQGAIQGPEEFAEGLALGVKSMLGHAVGESLYHPVEGRRLSPHRLLATDTDSYFVVLSGVEGLSHG